MKWIAIIVTLIAATSPALADPLPSIEKVLSEGSRWETQFTINSVVLSKALKTK